MKQLRVLVLFQLLLLVLSCQKEGTKAESQIQPVYDVVREVNLSTLASKSGVEVIRFGKGVIVDFNQLPSKSVFGIHVYDEKGDLLLEKMDSSYYVKTDRKKS